MTVDIRHIVEQWKLRTLKMSDIPLEVACDSIGTDSQLFEAKRVNAVEWVLCLKGQNKPAVFSYAAIFAGCDPMDTGNLLPNTDYPTTDLLTERAEVWASYKCSYAYSFDTSEDPGLFHWQSVLDKYMQDVPGFNVPNPKPRRPWQSGQNSSNTHRFWMRAPMFLRLKAGERKGPFPEHLHDWLREADRRSRAYRANPARPTVLVLEDRMLRCIEDCDPNHLMRGDAVAITFSVTYIEGKKDWYPTFIPIDIVRVARSYSSWNIATEGPSVDMVAPRAPLTDGQLIDDGAMDVEDNPDDDVEIHGVTEEEVLGFAVIPVELLREAMGGGPTAPAGEIAPVDGDANVQEVRAGPKEEAMDVDEKPKLKVRTIDLPQEEAAGPPGSSTVSTLSSSSGDSGPWSDAVVVGQGGDSSDEVDDAYVSEGGGDKKRKKTKVGTKLRRVRGRR